MRHPCPISRRRPALYRVPQSGVAAHSPRREDAVGALHNLVARQDAIVGPLPADCLKRGLSDVMPCLNGTCAVATTRLSLRYAADAPQCTEAG